MNLGEILSDAFVYPLNNIKALIIYVILGIVAGIAGGAAVFGIAGALVSKGSPAIAFDGLGILGFIVFVLVLLLIDGYCLDIIKFGINRDPGAPGIDFVRQVVNAIKLIIVEFVYYLIPIIIAIILGFLLGNGILTLFIMFVIGIIFSLALLMATCRLAKTDSLGEALAIGEAIGDIGRVGALNIIILVIVLCVILFIATLFCIFVASFGSWGSTLASILLGIFGVYFAFASFRATGLLYSNA